MALWAFTVCSTVFDLICRRQTGTFHFCRNSFAVNKPTPASWIFLRHQHLSKNAFLVRKNKRVFSAYIINKELQKLSSYISNRRRTTKLEWVGTRNQGYFCWKQLANKTQIEFQSIHVESMLQQTSWNSFLSCWTRNIKQLGIATEEL